MARTEQITKKQKNKGKKRKHETQNSGAESDEEVANKSLIVEPQEETNLTAKAQKRKQNDAGQKAVKQKRSKLKAAAENQNNVVEDAADENENQLPTAEQLEEASKPENLNGIVTQRQKKKLKHQQRLVALKGQNIGKESKRNEEYLQKWKTERHEWKFEKLRQISIQHTVFDEQKLSIDIWPLALEYLSGSKGAAKEIITKLAENVIQELDKQCEQLEDDEQRQAIVDSSRYQRARDVLQSFD